MLLADIDRPLAFTDEECHSFRQGTPGERLAAARLALCDHQPEQGRRLLKECLSACPGLIEAHVQLGEVLLGDGDTARLADWEAALPADADEHPGVWLVRARWALAEGRHAEEARCWAELVRRHPNHLAAHHGLAQTLRFLGRDADAALVQSRSDQLREFISHVIRTTEGPGDLADWRAAAELAERLGRAWEASAWARTVLQQDASQTWARRLLQRVQRRLNAATPWTIPELNPVVGVDFSNLPLPRGLREGPGSAVER